MIKRLFRRWLNVEPEVIEVKVTMPKVIEILDTFQEKLSNRATVLSLASENATDFERGRIKGQIEMLSKVTMEIAGSENEKS